MSGLKHPLISRAVFPVAGKGTRFLPATKATPKEMMPIVDKPLIQYAVEEAVGAGVSELIFVTSSTKRAIEDHFDSNYELESFLKKQNKHELLALVQNVLPQGASCTYVRQSESLGLGHAVLCARTQIANEPFALLLADDLIHHEAESCLQQMVSAYEATGCSIIAVQEISVSESEKYGMVAVEPQANSVFRITSIVEKPKPQDAPSNLAVVGRYILTPKVMAHLVRVQQDKRGEIQLTDAISSLLQDEPVYALKFKGVRYDCGNKLGYLQAIVSYALAHTEVGSEFENYLQGSGRVSKDFSRLQKK